MAAVQGLYLKSQDASLSSQNLTNFLSQVIRSDPVRLAANTHINLLSFSRCLSCHGINRMFGVCPFYFTGLFAVMPGADRISAGVQPEAGSAAQRHDGNQTRGRGRGPVLHPDRCQRHQHLKPRRKRRAMNPMIDGGKKVVDGGGRRTGGPGRGCGCLI